jgi:NAD(P)-dependent dehydrogenase (short-subunit alcohol dehydrogenase family)
MGNLVVVGGSRGLGGAFVEGLSQDYDHTIVVSRTEPSFDQADVNWIQADLRQPELAAEQIAAGCPDPIDLLIYNAGIWEKDKTVGLEDTPPTEIADIISVNLTAPMLVVGGLWNQLKAGKGGSVVFIGSIAGYDRSGNTRAAYGAAKAGLRNFNASVRTRGQPVGIQSCLIAPGSTASDIPLSTGVEAARTAHNGRRMPVQDLVRTVQFIASLSDLSSVAEIILPAATDGF